jgi:hypothetical protein
MLAFDVTRADWCDAVLDRAFRRGLILLRGGERSLRFYPRYDTEPYVIDEAISILRLAIEDLVGGDKAPPPKIRVGTLNMPLDTIDTLLVTPADFEAYKLQMLAVEQERYGPETPYPPDVLRMGRRPLLQFPLETLEATMASPRAFGVVLRDRVSGRIVGYALGSALEDHNEEGVASDPHFGDNNTFFLQAMATSPTVQNDVALENLLLEAVSKNASQTGFAFLSTLIEERLLTTGPPWISGGTVLQRMDNYLRSGITFAYVQATLPSATT